MLKKILLLSLLMLAGCSKLTIQNYDKLEVGMDYKAVIQVLGNPDNCEEKFGTNGCLWGDKNSKHIKVSFIANKAVFFEQQNLD
ncbi:DUF3862 domain-containing protein [Neptunicella sp. SCSIO 80796]|uniref:DUF3862 domain-containing protein n=1 Tax=Neptunicella plasticusilytica TaxID=3117012 RepID=UPI003A4D9172